MARSTTRGRKQLLAQLVGFRSLYHGELGQWCGQSCEIGGHGANDRSVIVKSPIDQAAAMIGRNCNVLRGKRTRYSHFVSKCIRDKLFKIGDVALPAKPPDAFPASTVLDDVRPPLHASLPGGFGKNHLVGNFFDESKSVKR